DTNGCYSQYGSVLSIQTYDPVVDFEDTVCFGQEILFSPEDTINYTYTWDFGDGTTSNLQFPSHQYSAPGAYEVTFEATHAFGCTQTYTLDSVYIIGFEQDFTVTDSVLGCMSDTLQFMPEMVNGSSYQWIISGSGLSFMSSTSSTSLSPIVLFRDPGLFTVELITHVGHCVDTVLKNDVIEIFEVSANFAVNQLDYCDPFLLEVVSSSINADYHYWDYLGISSPDSSIIQINVPHDTINIHLTVANEFGCIDNDTVIFNPEKLIAGLSSSNTQGCTPHSIDFTSESENAASFYWDFGDGTTSVLENPSHTYTSAGSFDVMLVVQPSSGNCSDTIFFPNYVLTSSPEADFSIIENYSCAPMIVEFVDSSSDALTWNWDFGDGSSSSLQNPLHVYNTPGSYSIELTVTDVNGCQSTKLDSNAVFVPGPIADFSVSQTAFCDSGEVQFTDLSTDAVSWSWTFGDGNASNLQNPTHNFVGNGAFTVALIVEDSAGCATSLIMDTLVHIYETPNAQFIVNDSIGCMPLDVTLTDYSAGADSWFWDMGDGVQYSSIPSLHTYSNQGTYQVNLVASVSGMCYDTAFKDVQVLDFADATVNPVADLCQQNSIITLSPVQTGGVWSGSGITSASMGTFDPNVAGAGTHTIFYTMPGTCAASDSVQITVLPNLDAEIDSIDEVCLSQGQLTIPVTNLGGVWSGIGIIDSTTGLFDPSVSGTGNFMLTYTTSNGICTDTDSVEVTVLMDADPTITPVSDFCEQAASMNLVSNQSGGVWSGPGIVSSATGEFSSSLAGPGTHTISYEIAGACGNMDTVQITVHEFIEAAITPVADLCAGQASFDLNSSNSGGTWSGVGITDSLAGTFDPSVSGIGSFVVFYTTTNGTCSDEDS
ncbi:MAG TPA: hypothetical protein DCF89_06640, partial [Flavobacteriales bacterium]|nr:hypothetical protein [Flavobacteriales bacterium]